MTSRPNTRMHVADGNVPTTPRPGQHPSEQRFRVLSDLGWLLRWLAVPIAIVFLVVAGRCSRADARPTPPGLGLLAHEDVLAIARRANAALVVIDARIAWGRGRVEFYKGLTFLSDPAGALGLPQTPSNASSSRGTEVGRMRSTSVPVGRSPEFTRFGRGGAWFEAAARSFTETTVNSGPGAIRDDRAGLPPAGPLMSDTNTAARLRTSPGREHLHNPFPRAVANTDRAGRRTAGAGGFTDEAGAFPRRTPCR